MALNATRLNKFTGQSQPTYVKIVHVSVDTRISESNIAVLVYDSETARLNNAEPLESVNYKVKNTDEDTLFSDFFNFAVLSEEDSNPFIQAYNYLKTLDEYDGAVDC